MNVCKLRTYGWLLVLASMFPLLIAARAQTLSTDSAATASTVTTFHVVPTPEVFSINAFSADSETDLWATSFATNVALHFNGSTWGTVQMAPASRINKIAVISPTDIWAVAAASSNRSQIQHFNGSTWSVVSSPHFVSGEVLNSIKVLSPTNIFAVGFFFLNATTRTPLVEHFNGTKWSVVTVPQISAGELDDLAIVSATNIWAVGGVGGATPAALTMHFNGVQWIRVSAPTGFLSAVTALAGNNVWAVGSRIGTGALIEHWNGTAWKVVPSPTTSTIGILTAISAISASDIWAAGCDNCGDVGGTPPLIEHWNGASWTINPAPTQAGGVAGNTIIAFPASKDVFVGGFVFASSGPQSIVYEGTEGQ